MNADDEKKLRELSYEFCGGPGVIYEALLKAMNIGLARGREEMREEAAKVCEKRYMGDNNREDLEARACASAIRALK